MNTTDDDVTYIHVRPSRGLSFHQLRAANAARLPQFKNSKGELAHTKADGSDWTPSQWLEAVVGELGEYANWRKKFNRGDITFEEFKRHAAKELAGVATYLDILARRCLDMGDCIDPIGIDLGHAIMEKFNEVSDRVGATIKFKSTVLTKAPN